MTWRTLRTIVHSLMVHMRVLEAYIHFAFIYTTDHVFPLIPIKYLINEDGDLTTSSKLATGTKTLVSHLRVLFCPCVLQTSTAHVRTKTLNIRHQAQKGFCGISVGIPQHQKGYLVYVPGTRDVISSHDVVFGEFFSSTLVYTSQPYAEAMHICLSVSYTPYATSSREKIVNIITFVPFEEGRLLFETQDDE